MILKFSIKYKIIVNKNKTKFYKNGNITFIIPGKEFYDS